MSGRARWASLLGYQRWKHILLLVRFLLLPISKHLTLFASFWSQCLTSDYHHTGGSLWSLCQLYSVSGWATHTVCFPSRERGDHPFDAHGDHCFGEKVPHPFPNTDIPGKSIPGTHTRNCAAFQHCKTQDDSPLSVASDMHTHNGSNSVCDMFRSVPYKHKAVPK